MSEVPAGDLPSLLRRWGQGDKAALDSLIPLVYDELRRIAGYHLRLEAPYSTIQATALVHEAYLRLVRDEGRDWNGRTHFFAVASRVIRHVLVDLARERLAQKRGGDAERVPLTGAMAMPAPEDEDVLRLSEALDGLEQLDPLKARIVELRYFGGLSIEETAETLQISPATVKRHFGVARLWLHRQLQLEPAGADRQ